MSSMPERIWAWVRDDVHMEDVHTEYVRADIVAAKDAEIESLTESERILSEQVMELRDEVMRLRQGEPSMTLRNFREMQTEIERLTEAFNLSVKEGQDAIKDVKIRNLEAEIERLRKALKQTRLEITIGGIQLRNPITGQLNPTSLSINDAPELVACLLEEKQYE